MANDNRALNDLKIEEILEFDAGKAPENIDWVLVYDRTVANPIWRKIDVADFQLALDQFLRVDGANAMIGDLQCNQNAQIDGTLGVDGATDLNGTLDAQGNVNLQAELDVAGIVRLANTVAASGDIAMLLGALIACQDSNGITQGAIGASADGLGMTLFGGEDFASAGVASIVSENTLISADSLLLKFNGATNGEFLRLGTAIPIAGNQFFSVLSTPLDVAQHEETFQDTTDIVLTTAYQNVVQGTTVNAYQVDSSFTEYVFKLENQDVIDHTVNISITSNDGIPTEIFTATVPRRNGGTNGTLLVTGADTTSEGVVNVGDTVEMQVQLQAAAGAPVTVRGSQQTTQITLVQNADLGAPALEAQAADTTLDVSRYNRITNGTLYTLPAASSSFSSNKVVGTIVKNVTGGNITIDTTGGDTIYTSAMGGGAKASITLSDGESMSFVVGSASQWDTQEN